MELTAVMMIIHRLWNHVVVRLTEVFPAMFTIVPCSNFMTRSVIHANLTLHTTLAIALRMRFTTTMTISFVHPKPSSRSYSPSFECSSPQLLLTWSFSVISVIVLSRMSIKIVTMVAKTMIATVLSTTRWPGVCHVPHHGRSRDA